MTRKFGSPTVMDIFVTRPVLAVVLSLVLVIMGIIAARNLAVLQYPKIESSSLVISTTYIGASAEVVQGFITDPIERVHQSVGAARLGANGSGMVAVIESRTGPISISASGSAGPAIRWLRAAVPAPPPAPLTNSGSSITTSPSTCPAASCTSRSPTMAKSS